MASPSDTTNQEMLRRRKKGAPIKFLVPLIYAPALPLIRLTLRHKPVLRDRLFTAVLAGAFAHGFYLVYPLSSCLFIFHFSLIHIPYAFLPCQVLQSSKPNLLEIKQYRSVSHSEIC